MAGNRTPREELIEVSRALVYALEHPGVDREGTLQFSVKTIGRLDPISKPGGLCPRPIRGLWTLQDVGRMAALVETLAREVGGGPAARPARR